MGLFRNADRFLKATPEKLLVKTIKTVILGFTIRFNIELKVEIYARILLLKAIKPSL